MRKVYLCCDMLIRNLTILIRKEFMIELRQKYALGGMVLYLGSSIFVIFMALNLKGTSIHPLIWNAIFWIIILFTAANSIAKSFIQERKGLLLYYYTILNPVEIILSKIIYNTVLMFFLIFLGNLMYSVVLGNPVDNLGLFMLCMLLASFGFSVSFTMISSIASQASHSSTLMAILGFPVILPMLLLVLKISKNAIDGLPAFNSYDEIITLASIIAIILTSSILLFPYLWKSS